MNITYIHYQPVHEMVRLKYRQAEEPEWCLSLFLMCSWSHLGLQSSLFLSQCRLSWISELCIQFYLTFWRLYIICQILWLFKCSPDWLLNFFTGGFGDLLESYGDGFLETWGISLLPLFKNAFDFCSTKPFLLLGEFFRCPSRTSGWLPVTEVTIVGNGSGCLVVVRCVVVDLVGGGPHIKSEVKK